MGEVSLDPSLDGLNRMRNLCIAEDHCIAVPLAPGIVETILQSIGSMGSVGIIASKYQRERWSIAIGMPPTNFATVSICSRPA